EVASLRALLAAKEAALEEAEAAVAVAAEIVRQHAAAYDGDLASLAEARGLLEAEEAQVAGQEQALQESERQAAARSAAVDDHQAQLRQQATALGAAAAAMRAEAEGLVARVAAAAASQEQRRALAQADDAAREELRGLERVIADVGADLARISEQRGRLAAERAAAQEALAGLQRTMPELEAAKRAAAANKDFREAARLSGELKALTLQAESAAAQLARHSAALSELAAAEGSKASELQELRGMLGEAQRQAAEAHHRYLVFCLQLSHAALEEAAAAELYEEAGSLQAEVAAAEAEALQLERTWGFVRSTATATVTAAAAAATAAGHPAEAATAGMPNPTFGESSAATAALLQEGEEGQDEVAADCAMGMTAAAAALQRLSLESSAANSVMSAAAITAAGSASLPGGLLPYSQQQQQPQQQQQQQYQGYPQASPSMLLSPPPSSALAQSSGNHASPSLLPSTLPAAALAPMQVFGPAVAMSPSGTAELVTPTAAALLAPADGVMMLGEAAVPAAGATATTDPGSYEPPQPYLDEPSSSASLLPPMPLSPQQQQLYIEPQQVENFAGDNMDATTSTATTGAPVVTTAGPAAAATVTAHQEAYGTRSGVESSLSGNSSLHSSSGSLAGSAGHAGKPPVASAAAPVTAFQGAAVPAADALFTLLQPRHSSGLTIESFVSSSEDGAGSLYMEPPLSLPLPPALQQQPQGQQ
ncbi:hypothetical protein Agub_g2310, partial [Astrephomene gubernaculifera]